MAELPPLPPRRLRRLRPALGRPGGRRVRARRAPLRGAGRRRAARQLHPARPRRGHACRGCATSPTCRSASTPTSATCPTHGWRFETGVGGAEFAALALRWREEGAQIVGGCCGVGPEHIGAARRALEGTPPGSRRSGGRRADRRRPPAPARAARAALDRRARARPLPAPLPGPDLRARRVRADAGQLPRLAPPVPRAASARGKRCLDIGCGTGLLTVQLALNGAAHVHAIDLDERAVANTLTNAFRNGVADRVTAARVDLYPWVPEERYDVIVASLYQTAGRPVRAGHDAPPARLLGPQPDRPPDREAARGARRRRRRLRHAAVDHRAAADRRAARGARPRGARRRLRRSSSSASCSPASASRSSASSSCPTRTTSRSTATT